jgi:hypothetical protein
VTARKPLRGRLDRERGKRRTSAPAADEAGLTPYQKLVRAAETGRFETLVRKARPAQPVAMVKPEEREKALREAGQWTAEKPVPPEMPPEETPAPEPTRELTASEAYVEEHCRWVPLAERRYRPRIPYGRCITEYDWYTGKMIGDGYARYGGEDE